MPRHSTAVLFAPTVLPLAAAAPAYTGQRLLQGAPIEDYQGPADWGLGLDVGPASLADASPDAHEWHAGLAPERTRFASFGPQGPPTAGRRGLSSELAGGLSCRICQLLVRIMWGETAAPTSTTLEQWLAAGCTSNVRRALQQAGWHVTDLGCEGAGLQVWGHTWCLLQDPTREVVRRPELSQVYDPSSDALFLACERTLGAHGRATVAFLEAHRGQTLARGRNERLAVEACAEAAHCQDRGGPGPEAANSSEITCHCLPGTPAAYACSSPSRNGRCSPGLRCIAGGDWLYPGQGDWSRICRVSRSQGNAEL